jgi:hypothetical protein
MADERWEPWCAVDGGRRYMIWHVIYADQNGTVQSRAARSSEHALDMAYELHRQSFEVRRIIAPDGSAIAHPLIDRRYAQGDQALVIPPNSGADRDDDN